MSQNVDIGLRFCFMVCKKRNFEKNGKNHKSYPFFAIKQKRGPKFKKLRHASLDENVV